MKNFKSHFKFNKQERSGIFFLLLIIVLLQVGYFIFRSTPSDESMNSFSHDLETQAQNDILKENALRKDSIKIYPFNPNFITDYKGYTLGMSIEEIDRLHDFRAEDQYVNSPEAFQKVTQVSDSLLKAIAPHFKFPEWTQKSKQQKVDRKQESTQKLYRNLTEVEINDLNSATAEDLKTIYGIGEKLSARIIKFRDRLGGFLVDEQLYDVYGLDSTVVKKTLAKFKVINPPRIEKISLTWASYNELHNLLYISNKFAKSIIEHRKKEKIMSFSELQQLDGFPEGKLSRLQLYLSL